MTNTTIGSKVGKAVAQTPTHARGTTLKQLATSLQGKLQLSKVKERGLVTKLEVAHQAMTNVRAQRDAFQAQVTALQTQLVAVQGEHDAAVASRNTLQGQLRDARKQLKSSG